jgi:adenosylhomocysteine nucleosidase
MTKEDILLVVALESESNGLFEKIGVDILYVGVGKVNAVYFLTKKLLSLKNNGNIPKYVINLGSCGSNKFCRGELIACNEFIQRDMDATAFGYKLGETPCEKSADMILKHKKIVEDLKYGICGSGDNFATKPCEMENVDLVDMEAYGLAKVCLFEGVDFISIKYVTDELNERGATEWKGELRSAGESLCDYFTNSLVKKLKINIL